MQRLAEAAIAAAERATAAAAAAASGELHRALPPAVGSVLPDALAMTELECVVHSNPALGWTKMEAGERGNPMCEWCRVPFNLSSEANSLRVIKEHLGGARHISMAQYCGRTMTSFFQPLRGPAAPPPPPAPRPDRSILCAGYHWKTTQIGWQQVDLTPLLQVPPPTDFLPTDSRPTDSTDLAARRLNRLTAH